MGVLLAFAVSRAIWREFSTAASGAPLARVRGAEDTTMSQQAVERAIGKLATDESFRIAFTVDPQRASLEAGLRLSPTEIAALLRIPTAVIEQFAEGLDDCICRLPCGSAARENG
jgi:hypothetical protein